MVGAGRANDRLLPQGRLAGPMPWIVAIMIFLTVLACAAGVALGESAAVMRDAAASRLTVQVTEADAPMRDALAERLSARIASLPGVTRVEVASREVLERQLAPWLGGDAEAAGIPVPALIDVDLAPMDAAAARARVTDAVATTSRDARVEPHAAYLGPVAALVRRIGWIAFGIVALMAVATGCVVVLAARGAHAMHRGTIDIMHMLGATDGQVMRLFQRRLARDISFGAAVGLLAAIALILLIGRSVGLLAGDVIGSVALPWWGWAILPLLPLFFILVAWVAARLTLQAALERSL